jgi:hypothetical protein
MVSAGGLREISISCRNVIVPRSICEGSGVVFEEVAPRTVLERASEFIDSFNAIVCVFASYEFVDVKMSNPGLKQFFAFK